jgi:hypothetical protein
MIMSDTPAVQFFTRTWAVGLVLAVAVGVLLGRTVVKGFRQKGPHRHAVGGGVAAVSESGLFVVLPATAVWQAATTLRWTGSPAGDVIAAAAAALAVTAQIVWPDPCDRLPWQDGYAYHNRVQPVIGRP